MITPVRLQLNNADYPELDASPKDGPGLVGGLAGSCRNSSRSLFFAERSRTKQASRLIRPYHLVRASVADYLRWAHWLRRPDGRGMAAWQVGCWSGRD